MTVENISWSISTKECCRPRRWLNPRPPGLQLDGASITLLLSRLSPLSGLLVLWAFFRQKLTTALLESAEGREWPQKIFHDQSPRKNVAEPTTYWSPVGHASNWATEAGKQMHVQTWKPTLRTYSVYSKSSLKQPPNVMTIFGCLRELAVQQRDSNQLFSDKLMLYWA